ncbi:gp201 [Bacillus phage W.Ph.]|uniref:Gp201 n=1 Tax=Bacillus phage W.Ph. TaxID=764595 RepID=G9B1V2_9CAUD|nr:gp201 [Bacillus phage W.Ph.]ADH03347.1 gp201 [Bacillus phage W.Ph.]
MIRVLLQDIREGYKEKKTFNDEKELQMYLRRNPFVIVKDRVHLVISKAKQL